MKKIYRIVSSCMFIFLFTAFDSLAQNNLSAGDIVITSYQSDKDSTNTENGGTTSFTDRFSIVVLKEGGLAAYTVIYFTDNGWNAGTGDFVSGLSEGFIKWEVPVPGIPFGTQIYFISKYVDPVMSWKAYTSEAGTTTSGTVSTESGSNYMELSTAGDQVLAYQTGTSSSSANAAGAYNNATRRFITAIHANEETGTTSAAWDGNSPVGGHQSSMPTGLTNGKTAFLIKEKDNGKYNLSTISVCYPDTLTSHVYIDNNWVSQNTPFAIDATADDYTFTLLPNTTISWSPADVYNCVGLSASFSVYATNASGYQWQQSTDAAFTTPVTLSNTSVYSGTATDYLTVLDNTGLNGRYYRAVANNSCNTVNSNAAKLSYTLSTLPTASVTNSQAVNTNNNLYYSSPCKLIAKVVPSGASRLTGNVTSQVWVEGSVPTYAGQPFVARHYQITPATNATTATGTVTLYFTQAEFNAFNADAGSALDLPTGSTDNIGKTNLRVGKYSGSSNDGTGLPGSYTSMVTVIDPADANIVWNATDSRWEITFDVTGFSGFIIQTSASPLPVNLISFNGRLTNNDAYLQWKTDGETNNNYFDIERSLDGQTFVSIGRVAGNNGTTQTYNFIDAGAAQLHSSKLFYRLKIVSTTGEVEYSNIVTLSVSASGSPVVTVTPNPFTSGVKISLEMPVAAQLTITLSDITGKKLRSEYVNAPKGPSTLPLTGMGNLVQGIYILSVQCNGQTYTYKLVK